MRSRSTVAPRSSSRRPAGTLFLLIGPSQVGKDTVLREIVRRRALRLRKVISVTTRVKRPREVEGLSYFFVSDKQFDDFLKRGELMEWAHIQTHRSGTPVHPTIDLLKQGWNLIEHIDVQGADAMLRRKDLKVVSIFLAPGSLNDVKQRLQKKHFSEHERRVRWQTMLREMKRMNDYDFRVVNVQGKLKETIREVEEIMRTVR